MQESSLLSIAALLLCIVCAYICAASVRRARSESGKAQRALDELVLVQDSLDVLRTGLKRTEGRIIKGTQRASAKPDPEAEPDPKSDPDAWKQWQNRRIFTKRSLQ